jgi:hypothetical protein
MLQASIKTTLAHRQPHIVQGCATRFETTPAAGVLSDFQAEADALLNAKTNDSNRICTRSYFLYDKSERFPGLDSPFSYLVGSEEKLDVDPEKLISYTVPESDEMRFEAYFYFGEPENLIYDDETMFDELTTEMRKHVNATFPHGNYIRNDGPDCVDWFFVKDDCGWFVLRYCIPVKKSVF